MESLRKVRHFLVCYDSHGRDILGGRQALGMNVLITHATERASFHDGRLEQEMKTRLDVSRITVV